MGKTPETTHFESQAPTEWCRSPGKTSSRTPGSSSTPVIIDPREPLGADDAAGGGERIERLGGGGFGEVWRVRYLGSEEAWKFIPIRPGSSERTGREAIHARRVDHQNVVRVLDVLRLKDHFVLRMDLVRGRDFFRVINEDGILPPIEAARFGLQIAAALSHAHRQGVVHLDLKPHNLIMNEDGVKVMVTDFGISASLAQEWGDPPQAAGTPYFMAPEQFDPECPPGGAIDTWSLGVTLYWSMSLAYPFRFDGREPREVIAQDRHLPLVEAAPHVPPALGRILDRMLEKDPARRLPMDEVIRELRTFLENQGDHDARAGDQAFALCDFETAAARYTQAARSGGEEGERARSLAARVELARSEHDAALQRIEEHHAADDPASALLELNGIRRRFSRSARFQEARGRIEAWLQDRFAAPRRNLERELRRAHFAEAWRYLNQLSAVLGIPGARKILLAAGEEAAIDGPSVERLRVTVDQREALHGKLATAVEEAVQEMDFLRARDVMEELQNHFPLPENLEKMRAYSVAVENLSFLADYTPEALARIESGEVLPLADRPLHLARAEARCLELLRTFSPEAYPRFQEIAERARLLERTIRVLLSRAAPEAEAIRVAYQKRDLARVRTGLSACGNLILHTDILAEEVRDAVRDIRDRISGMFERSDRLHREGVESMERRQFHKAITAFEEALRLGGGSHGDLDALILKASESAEKRRLLAEELHALDLSSTAKTNHLPELPNYLERAAELLDLQEEPRRKEILARAAAFLGAVAEATAREALAAPGDERIESLKEIVAAISRVSPEFLSSVAVESAELPGHLEALAAAVLDPLGPAGSVEEGSAGHPALPGELELRLERLARLVETFSALRPLFSHPAIAEGRHPSLLLADRILAFARAAGASPNGGKAESLSREAGALLGTLAESAPPGVAAAIRNRRRRVLDGVARRRLAQGAKSILSRLGRMSAPFILSLVITGLLLVSARALLERKSALALDALLTSVRDDARWSKVEGLTSIQLEERAMAFRLLGRDLPAFSSLDGVSDRERRFWSRAVEGARLLTGISREETAVLGRTGIRRAIEETLAVDLADALEVWLERTGGDLPGNPVQPRPGVPELLLRLAAAKDVLASLLARAPGPEDRGGFQTLFDHIAAHERQARSMGDLVSLVPRWVAELKKTKGEGLRVSAASLWDRRAQLCGEAPSDAWRRFLDRELVRALCLSLRDELSRGASGRGIALDGNQAWELIHLIARIREAGGPLPVEAEWTRQSDPLYGVLAPLVK